MLRLAPNVLVRTSLVMAAVFLHASLAGAQECRKDSDCAGDSVCEDGRCAGTNGPAAQPKPTTPGTSPSSTAPAPGQAAPLPGSVAVKFVPRDPKDTLVVRDRYANVSCTAPCTLELPPGLRTIQVGDSQPEDLNVPAQGGTFSVAAPQRGKRTAGIVLLSVGAPVAALAALVAVAAGSAETSASEVASGVEPQDNSGAKTGGMVVAIVAGALAVYGIVLIATADTKAVRPEATKDRGAGSNFRTLRPTANFDAHGGGSFGLTGTF